jgi:hypothetical protein
VILLISEGCIYHNHNHNNIKAPTDSTIKFSQPTQDSNKLKNSSVENAILDKIHNLPEVKAKQHFIDSLTNHKSGISMIILKTPSNSKPYYWIQVGYDNSIRFEPYYNFYVYRKGLVINFFDPMTNRILNLEEWRKDK